MSKYVRIDERIIDCEEPKWKHHATYTEQAYIYAMSKKAANTIKELCDEFVVIDKNIPYRPNIIYGVDITEFAKNNKGLCDIYGAIWTEWGLKYVAKMNDKGELELCKD